MQSALRTELTPMPPRMRTLPVDARGYPVPWFVALVNGIPDHRVTDRAKFVRAINERRCWVCGQQLGVHFDFVIGPMCGINRTTAEPPLHHDCAAWSVTNCPFLTRPHARRREDDLTHALIEHVAGEMLPRNPGVTLMWSTRSYQPFLDGRGGWLLQIGNPDRVQWFCEGRAATRDEVVQSVSTGVPSLLERAREQDALEPHGDSETELWRRCAEFERLYPAV